MKEIIIKISDDDFEMLRENRTNDPAQPATDEHVQAYCQGFVDERINALSSKDIENEWGKLSPQEKRDLLKKPKDDGQ